MNVDLLMLEIEDKREELKNLYEKENQLISEEILAKSNELDELIVKYLKLAFALHTKF